MNFSKKNIIITISAIVVLIALLVLIIFLNTKKTSEIVRINGNNGSNQNIPILPETKIASDPDLNTIQKSMQNELANVQNTGSQISEKSYKDPSGKIISLDDFVKANEFKIESGVLQNASQKDYSSFSCAKTKGERPAIGLMLQLRRDVDPKKYQQSYPDMEKNMKNWEKNMFQDVLALFFPGESFDKDPAFGEAKYTTSNTVNNISIRFANLTAVSGKQYSIDWGFLNDRIFISNGKDCLRRELDQNADAFEP
jgi:hypothetical protein